MSKARAVLDHGLPLATSLDGLIEGLDDDEGRATAMPLTLRDRVLAFLDRLIETGLLRTPPPATTSLYAPYALTDAHVMHLYWTLSALPPVTTTFTTLYKIIRDQAASITITSLRSWSITQSESTMNAHSILRHFYWLLYHYITCFEGWEGLSESARAGILAGQPERRFLSAIIAFCTADGGSGMLADERVRVAFAEKGWIAVEGTACGVSLSLSDGVEKSFKESVKGPAEEEDNMDQDEDVSQSNQSDKDHVNHCCDIYQAEEDQEGDDDEEQEEGEEEEEDEEEEYSPEKENYHPPPPEKKATIFEKSSGSKTTDDLNLIAAAESGHFAAERARALVETWLAQDRAKVAAKEAAAAASSSKRPADDAIGSRTRARRRLVDGRRRTTIG